MAKAAARDKEITKVRSNVPAHLQSYTEDNTLEAVSQHVVLPRLKVIQGTSDGTLKKNVGGDGAVILRPGDQRLATPEEPFLVVPIFFWVDYYKRSDLRDTELPLTVEHTLDPYSPLARRCMLPDKRKEVYPGQEDRPKAMCFTYIQRFNYIVALYHNEKFHDTMAAMQFQVGEFYQGTNFNSAVKMRGEPMWGQVWQIRSAFREPSADKKWWGLDFSDPEDGDPLFISPEEVDTYCEMYKAISQKHAEKLMVIEEESKEEVAREHRAVVDEPVDM